MRGELTEKMAVDLVSKFIQFILGNTGVDTSITRCENVHTATTTLQHTLAYMHDML